MSGRRMRQPAIRLFAKEYEQSDLIEQGSGEFDPSFVITKLGAKVNRMLVAGLLERMERRDTDNGANYRGSLRDPTGLHMFNVGSFQPELHTEMEELLALHDKGDPILLLAIGKSNSYTRDDGGVFTSIRLEEFTQIDGEGYARWLVDTSDATLRRIEFVQRSRDLDPSSEDFKKVGIPADLTDGLIKGRGHYLEVDTDDFMLGVLQALDRASGNMTTLTTESIDTGSDGVSESDGDDNEVRAMIVEYLKSNDPGDGVHYDQLMEHLATCGISRSQGEVTADALQEEGEVYEASFGYLRHISAS